MLLSLISSPLVPLATDIDKTPSNQLPHYPPYSSIPLLVQIGLDLSTSIKIHADTWRKKTFSVLMLHVNCLDSTSLTLCLACMSFSKVQTTVSCELRSTFSFFLLLFSWSFSSVEILPETLKMFPQLLYYYCPLLYNYNFFQIH
jgi:hypothetical protein